MKNILSTFTLPTLFVLGLFLFPLKSHAQIGFSHHKITVNKVALREKPMQNSKRLSILNKGDEVIVENGDYYREDFVEGVYGTWLKVLSIGMSGYVFEPYISSTKMYKRSESIYFYVVDTIKSSIGLSQFENSNWYSVEANKVQSCDPPRVVWDETSKVIHYDNRVNMVATNLYLPESINLSCLFTYNQIEINDTVYTDYSYDVRGMDSLFIGFKADKKRTLIDIKSRHEAYLFINIESLVDVNGDGILDILYTVSSNYEQHYFFLMSKNGVLEYESLPITFKEFPYEGC